MAVTSIWRVKGWLGKVVVYVENPDKTENPAFFQLANMTERQTQGLSDVLIYVVDTAKTEGAEKIKLDDEHSEVKRNFVSGVNCFPNTARDEMMAVKKRFGKEGGTVAYHGYQSFAPGEATPEMAHEIAVKLAASLWGERYQVVVATHLDKDSHLHSHFVVNTVSMIDGIKYHRTEKDYYDMQHESDRLCREYGLSVIAEPRSKGEHYAEWKAEKEGKPTYLSGIKNDVDRAISQAVTEREFFDILKKSGYRIKTGKDITVLPPGRDRGRKLMRNFGEDYSIENIRKRILSHASPKQTRTPAPAVRRMLLVGNITTAKKLTGFRALYVHYMYLMGVLPRKEPGKPSHRRIHYLYRADLVQLNRFSKEIRLLSEYRIDTSEQLVSFQAERKQEMTALTVARQKLRGHSRSVRDPDALAEIRGEISGMSKTLGRLREQVKLCEDILVRSKEMKEKIRIVNSEKNQERNGGIKHEPRR